MLKVKNGVTPKNLIIAAAIANVAESLDLDLVITSGTDGKHMVGSKHYTSEALDLRTSNIKNELQEVMNVLSARLGPDYQVIKESDHVHIEYDPRRG